jgi:hypothetical protein
MTQIMHIKCQSAKIIAEMLSYDVDNIGTTLTTTIKISHLK